MLRSKIIHWMYLNFKSVNAKTTSKRVVFEISKPMNYFSWSKNHIWQEARPTRTGKGYKNPKIDCFHKYEKNMCFFAAMATLPSCVVFIGLLEPSTREPGLQLTGFCLLPGFLAAFFCMSTIVVSNTLP